MTLLKETKIIYGHIIAHLLEIVPFLSHFELEIINY